MSTMIDDVPSDLLDRALQLTPSTRKKLGELLLDGVSEPDSSRTLIHSRIAKLVSGEAVLLDADEVLDELERRYQPEERQ